MLNPLKLTGNLVKLQVAELDKSTCLDGQEKMIYPCLTRLFSTSRNLPYGRSQETKKMKGWFK